MYSFKVNGKEYKIKFGYKVLAISNVLVDVDNANSVLVADDNGIEKLKILLNTTAKLVLTGLQKNHEEFMCDFESEDEVNKKLDDVYDMLDEYYEQENAKTPFDFFADLTNELVENGFFKKATNQIVTEIQKSNQRKSKKS